MTNLSDRVEVAEGWRLPSTQRQVQEVGAVRVFLQKLHEADALALPSIQEAEDAVVVELQKYQLVNESEQSTNPGNVRVFGYVGFPHPPASRSENQDGTRQGRRSEAETGLEGPGAPTQGANFGRAGEGSSDGHPQRDPTTRSVGNVQMSLNESGNGSPSEMEVRSAMHEQGAAISKEEAHRLIVAVSRVLNSAEQEKELVALKRACDPRNWPFLSLAGLQLSERTESGDALGGFSNLEKLIWETCMTRDESLRQENLASLKEYCTILIDARRHLALPLFEQVGYPLFNQPQ